MERNNVFMAWKIRCGKIVNYPQAGLYNECNTNQDFGGRSVYINNLSLHFTWNFQIFKNKDEYGGGRSHHLLLRLARVSVIKIAVLERSRQMD